MSIVYRDNYTQAPHTIAKKGVWVGRSGMPVGLTETGGEPVATTGTETEVYGILDNRTISSDKRLAVGLVGGVCTRNTAILIDPTAVALVKAAPKNAAIPVFSGANGALTTGTCKLMANGAQLLIDPNSIHVSWENGFENYYCNIL
jgi:hypothetical protein